MAGLARDPALADLAKALLEQSAVRRSLFGGFFRQPQWDMLLCLYVAMHEREALTADALLKAVGETGAAAGQWLLQLEQDGLVTRTGAGRDDPDAVVQISGEAAACLERLLQDAAAGAYLPGEAGDGVLSRLGWSGPDWTH